MWVGILQRGGCAPRRLAAMLFAAALLIGACRALAQPEPVLTVTVGHGGAIRPNRYFPIRVEITWFAKPGETVSGEPQAARVEASVPQDIIYTALITRDVTIQPGQRSEVVLYARSLVNVDEIEVALRDSRGRLLVESKANGSGVFGWWPIEDRQAIVMAVGRSRLPRSGWVFDHRNLSPVKVEELKAPALPREWPGYDGVSLVVLDDLAPDQLDAIQIRTLLEWVRQGGHLAITVTHQLDTYRQVLGDLDWPIAFDEYNSSAFDPSLREVLQGSLALALDPDAKRPTPGRRPAPPSADSAMGWYSAFMPELLKSIDELRGRHLYSRSIELGPEAVQAGWSVRRAEEWFNPLLTRETAGESRVGNIATGPYGLGTVTLLGIDPASLAGEKGRELPGLGWWHCVSHIAPIREAVSNTPEESGAYYPGYRSTTDSVLATSAVNDLLDQVSATFGARRGLFGAVSVALLLLVLLIGPGDYFVLRWMGREPLTWLTCPLLVLLACGAIYFAQESVSYGRARASRIALVDSWSGAAQGTATSFTAVSSARGGRYTLGGLSEGVYAAPTCWNPPYWFGGDAGTTTVAIDQGPAGARVRSVSIPLDNVRWLQDRGPISLPQITGAVRFDRARDRVFVDVTAPTDWSGRVVAVQWNGAWYKGDGEGPEIVGGRLEDALLPRDPHDQEAAKLRQRGAAASGDYYGTTWVAGWENDLAFQIAGHRQIGQRLAAQGPGFASVLISLDHRSEVQLMRDGAAVETEWTETMLMRLHVPAHSAGAEAEGNEP